MLSTGEQLAALAVVARKLRDPATIGRLDAAADSVQFYQAMASRQDS